MDSVVTDTIGKLGFGFMRLPMLKNDIDYDQVSEMVDVYMAGGFGYFDTAHNYLDGNSETAIRKCVVERKERDTFFLTNKLTTTFFNSNSDIRRFFEKQLKWCGVDFFDGYLMHAQELRSYKKFQECRAYETAAKLKEEGLIRHLGISFHDKPEILEMILLEHPEVEFVQIQFNYLDYDDPSVDGRGVYEVCRKYKKPIMVMEPVKGGNLVNLPPEADRVLRQIEGGGSNASFALRFAISFPGIIMVLSGMSNMYQMTDNMNTIKEGQVLSEDEYVALKSVCEIFKNQRLIQCTACRYCIDSNRCPKKIRIPDIFGLMNSYTRFKDWNSQYYYRDIVTVNNFGKASDCIKCGNCERACPQHLPIRELLEKVADTLE